MSHYFADSGQLDKGITALELYKQTYPRDSTPYNNLGAIYNQLGQFENALDNARQSMELDPDSISGYSNVANAYVGLNRLDEAKATLNQALQHKLGGWPTHVQLAGIAWARNDTPAMDQELDTAVKTGPAGEGIVYRFRSGVAAYNGQLRQAADFGKKAREAAERLNLKEVVANEYTQEAQTEALLHYKPRAADHAAQALKISQSPNVTLNAAFALAVNGDDQRAAKLADDIAQKRPYDTLVQFVDVPLVKAQIEINHGNAAKAIDLLDNAMVYGRVNSSVLYVRGNAYLRAGRAGDAVQAYQRLLEMKNFIGVDPLVPLSYLGLARAYAMQDDKARSRIAYQDFFGLWKDADPDIPLLREAKAEYAKVQ
jgi:eukaryotic-like serine/threonine-protein kinase